MINVYDFEVFKYDWLVVIINPVTKTKDVIVNDLAKLEAIHEARKKEIWVGYNSRGYDQYIYKGLLLGFDPKDINDFIIKKNMKGWQYSNLFNKIPLNNYDVFKPATDRGLKVHEAFMGHDIHETDVRFDIDRKLTPEELAAEVAYCTNDVEETLDIFIQRKRDFDAVFGIIKMFNLPLKYISKTETQLAAIVLGAQKRRYQGDEFDLEFPPNLDLGRYEYIKQWYLDNKSYGKHLKATIGGIPHTLAWGGLHGAVKKHSGSGIYIIMDAESFYPAEQIEYDWLSRAVPKEGRQKYIQMRDDRVIHKEQGDPRAYPEKIILNRVFGGCNDKYSALYDPKRGNDICVGGQLLMVDLIDKCEDFCDIFQSNTDGVGIKLRDEKDFDRLDDVAHEWETRNRMKLEFDEFSTVYQKDVNNYVAIAPDGSAKYKGAYVKKPDDLDYDLVVVRNALVNCMVDGISPEETVHRTENIRDFQKVYKVSSKYERGFHNGKELTSKVQRVFASTDPNDTFMGKQKKTGATIEKFTNCPDHCFIDNGHILGRSVDEYPKLDKQWYIDLAYRRLEQYGVSESA